jgi:hypothetical protein
MGVDGRVILKRILNRIRCYRLDSSNSRTGIRGENFKHGGEFSGFIRGGKFLDHLSDHYLPKKQSAPFRYVHICTCNAL